MIYTAVPAATLEQPELWSDLASYLEHSTPFKLCLLVRLRIIPQAYVNLEVAEEFRKQIAARLCKNCDRPGHKAKDCKQPKRPMQAGPDTECYKCHVIGHFASKCPNPRSFTGQC